MLNKRPAHTFLVIIASQFLGTSLWFAGNAVVPTLQVLWKAGPEVAGALTNAVQFGFIIGTLVFALLALADRLPATRLFTFCAIAGAAANLGVIFFAEQASLVLITRFLTGFLLAGIYPVGMKIAAGWYGGSLGNILGWLVGALVLGKAFPYLLSWFGGWLTWEGVIISASMAAATGGLLMLTLPEPTAAVRRQRFSVRQIGEIFSKPLFQRSVFGYLGHMWELYAFWAYVPFFIGAYMQRTTGSAADVALFSFLIIGIGAPGCGLAGLVSLRLGSAHTAALHLAASAFCCLVSPLLFFAPPWLFYPFMLFWGLAVVGDSGQLSALNARTAPRELVGTALTAATSIGFGITIISIGLLAWLSTTIPPYMLFLPLAAGPAAGLVSVWPLADTVTRL